MAKENRKKDRNQLFRVGPVIKITKSATGPDVVAELQSMLGAASVSKRTVNADPELMHALTKIATDAWRAKKKMVDPDSGEPRDEFKRVYRHIDSIFDALTEAEIQIYDPAGSNYDSGMALRVVSFEEMPGINRETVKETVKPAITWRGKTVQAGEVIVGTPMEDANE
jgi:hypothetical protein